jgi:hypothetical protein
MFPINNITANALQTQTLVLPSGQSFSITMYYKPMQFGWFFTNITYKTFTLNSMRIVNNPNLLYQWQDLLPFGLCCFSPSQREPTQQQDFSSGASNLYILTAAEVAAYATYIQGGAFPS